MTDNEIIKALEDKTHKAEYSWVDGSYCDVEVSLLKNALDLINRQKAKIEQWKVEANRWQNATIIDLKDEEEIKADAIKEFAERLKETIEDYQYVIDNLVKEMVGEE